MKNLEWIDMGEYNDKLDWESQKLNLPEFNQEVLIFLPTESGHCRINQYNGNIIDSDLYGRVVVGEFRLDEKENIYITDGQYRYYYKLEGIKWAEYNRPSQPNKQVKICENFICSKYDMREESNCNKVPCEKCEDEGCVNCKMFLSKSPNCKNSKIW